MTSRNRTRRGKSRTGRFVWANDTVSSALAIDTNLIIPLLVSAENFMKFDTTVTRVVIPQFSVTANLAAVNEERRFRWAIFTGQENLDSDDVAGLFSDTIGMPWMATGGLTALFAATAQSATFDMVQANGSVIDIKAKRRFRENDQILWLQVQNQVATGDADILVSAFIRTLLWIP